MWRACAVLSEYSLLLSKLLFVLCSTRLTSIYAIRERVELGKETNLPGIYQIDCKARNYTTNQARVYLIIFLLHDETSH